MTDAQQLIAEYRDLLAESAGSNPYRRGKAAREIPVVEDQIRAMKSHIEGRLEDGYRWCEENEEDPNFTRYEDLWISLLHDLERLNDELPDQYATRRLM